MRASRPGSSGQSTSGRTRQRRTQRTRGQTTRAITSGRWADDQSFIHSSCCSTLVPIVLLDHLRIEIGIDGLLLGLRSGYVGTSSLTRNLLFVAWLARPSSLARQSRITYRFFDYYPPTYSTSLSSCQTTDRPEPRPIDIDLIEIASLETLQGERKEIESNLKDGFEEDQQGESPSSSSSAGVFPGFRSLVLRGPVRPFRGWGNLSWVKGRGRGLTDPGPPRGFEGVLGRCQLE